METLSEVSGTGEKATLHSRALQDLFFIRLLPSRTGDVVTFPTQSNRHRNLDKVRRQRNLSKMKEQDKTRDRDIRKIVTCNRPERELKVMIIKMLKALEKRVAAITETLNTEVRKHISEIKSSREEMRNMVDGMTSRLEEAKE